MPALFTRQVRVECEHTNCFFTRCGNRVGGGAQVQSTGAKAILHDAGVSGTKLAELTAACPGVAIAEAGAGLACAEPLHPTAFSSSVSVEDERIIIFTSGTTGDPKGVRLPYRAYACNRVSSCPFLNKQLPSLKLLLICWPPSGDL